MAAMHRAMQPNRLAAISILFMISINAAWGGRHLLQQQQQQQRKLIVILNSIVPQGIHPNALRPNSLTTNALTTNSIQALLSVTQDGDAGELAHMLVKYLARCALDPSQSLYVNYTQTDNDGKVANVSETYTGSIGLAPSWASGPLNDVNSQEWVTACLIAHVNYYGKSVLISIRGEPDALKKATSGNELATYKTEEGAFWGNIFLDTPYLYACYNEAHVEYARSLFRECAAGHVMPDGSLGSCGPIQRVGPCDQVCSKNKGKGQYRTECHTPGNSVATDAVVTVYLP